MTDTMKLKADTRSAREATEPNGPTGRLATWLAHTTLDDVPDSVREHAKHLLLDGVACALVGAQLPVSRIGVEAVTTLDNAGSAFLIGWVIVLVVALIVINWLYEALMTSSPSGATLGKLALGLRIVRADGAQLSFGRATARHFLKVLITPLVPLAIGYLMAAFTARKRALHDVLADTLVIRLR